MQVWTDTWHKADAKAFKALYFDGASIFPPNKPTVIGNGNILNFMKGGLGREDVLFEPVYQSQSGHLAFEFGEFKDVDRSTQQVVAQGKYSITWILDQEKWKILNHTWSMPQKE